MAMLPVKVKAKTVAKGPSLLSRAAGRFAAEKARPAVRIGFVIDATASRGMTWVAAQTIQKQMFGALSGLGKLSLRLMHFGGNTLTDHGAMNDPAAIARAMAKVECLTGYTQYVPALRAFLEDDERPAAIILIGDMFEESRDELADLAMSLHGAGVKVFTFLEGDDATAARAFSSLAAWTGGAFARFGDALPLRDLCQGVALVTAGGEKAAARITNAKVKQLLLAGPSKT